MVGLSAIRVLIADDDALIREGLRIIIEAEPGIQVAGCVENGLEAVRFCEREEVDVALMDVRMPVMDGVRATLEISARTRVKIIILTTFEDDEYVLKAVKNGAKGYLLKNTPPGRLMDSIRLVHNGGTVMQDTVMDKIRSELSGDKSGNLDGSMFTKREIEIMSLIAKGLSNKEIADKLFISEGTAKNHITSILNKTGLEHRTQIAIYYLNGGKLQTND
jgi:DNA-binding NarL/FixJ family response regulator